MTSERQFPMEAFLVSLRIVLLNSFKDYSESLNNTLYEEIFKSELEEVKKSGEINSFRIPWGYRVNQHLEEIRDLSINLDKLMTVPSSGLLRKIKSETGLELHGSYQGRPSLRDVPKNFVRQVSDTKKFLDTTSKDLVKSISILVSLHARGLEPTLIISAVIPQTFITEVLNNMANIEEFLNSFIGMDRALNFIKEDPRVKSYVIEDIHSISDSLILLASLKDFRILEN